MERRYRPRAIALPRTAALTARPNHARNACPVWPTFPARRHRCLAPRQRMTLTSGR
jgi:hypothetical protein